MASELFGTSLFSDPNLVAYWRLENTSDSKGSRTLTNNNTVPFNAALFNNGADGGASNSNKYLSLSADTLGMTYTAAKSFSFWIKLTTEIASSSYVPIELRNTASGSITTVVYEFNSGTRRIYAERFSASSSVDDRSNVNMNLGTSVWHHIALVFTGSVLTLYVDGVSAGNTASTDGGSGPSTYTDGFGILAGAAGGGPTSGIIDDVAVFSRALSANEVLTIFNGSGTGMIGKFFGG